MHHDFRPTVTSWIATLSISTRLLFPKVRERTIVELTSRLAEIDPFDLIGLAVKYDVHPWLESAYHRIATRTDLITHAEAKKIPFHMAIMLMRSHELCPKKGHRFACSVSPEQVIDSEVKLMEKASKELPEKSGKAT